MAVMGGLFLAVALEASAGVTVKGRIVYGDVDPSREAANSSEAASIFSRGLTIGGPVAHVRVELRTQVTDIRVGWDETDEDGRFSIETGSSALGLETPGILRVEARNDYVNVKESKIIPLPIDGAIGAEFDINDRYDGGDVDLGNIALDDNVNTFTVWVVNTHPVSRAMFVAGSVYRAGRHIEELTGASLDIVWVRMGWIGPAWYDSQWYDPVLAWAGSSFADIVLTMSGFTTHQTIHLPGEDAATVDHEYGHFIEDSIGAFGLIPGYLFSSDLAHGLCEEQKHPCWAFTEGLASFYGAVNSRGFTSVSGVSFYGDPVSWDEHDALIALGDNWWIETTTAKCDSSARAGWSDPTAVESVVAQVLWDLVDSQKDPIDYLGTGVPEIAELPIRDVLGVLMADTSYSNPCGGLEVYRHPISLEQFCETYLALHPWEGVHPDLYAAFAFNGLTNFGCVVDNSGPGAVTISSSTHAKDVWNNRAEIALTITDGADDFSGSYYYWWEWDTAPSTIIGETSAAIGWEKFRSKATVNQTNRTLLEGDNQYLHVQTRDLARHLGTTAHFGPVRIDLTKPEWVSLSSPTATQPFLIGTYLHFEWQVTDNLSGVDYISIQYNDTASGIELVLPARVYGASGSYDFYLNPDVVVPTTSGSFTLIAVDHAGNGQLVNTPNITIVSPFAGPNDLGLALDQGRVVCGDLNGDGKDELVIAGKLGLARTLQIVQVSPALVVQNLTPGLAGGDLFLADFDRDGDLDLIAAGDFGGAGPEIYRFQNNGVGGFVSLGALAIPTMSDMVIRVVDLYGTGEPILVYGGRVGAGAASQELNAYPLQTGGSVLHLTGTLFRGGDFEVGDLNADGIFDFVTLGADAAGSGFIQTYLGKSQENQLSWVAGSGTSVVYPEIGDVDLGNWDLDNDLDFFAMFQATTPVGIEARSELREWLGSAFNGGMAAGGPNRIAEGDGHIVDIYNDGQSDVFALGRQMSGELSSWFVTNERLGRQGSGVPYPVRVNLLYCTDTAWGDFDNDGDLDVVITGAGQGGVRRTVWYENTVSAYSQPNADPPAPINLQSIYTGTGYWLSWEAPGINTDETAESAFEYEIRVGTTPGGSDVVTWAHPAGRGQQVAPQLVSGRFQRFVPMPAVGLDWCVRTVDSGWRRSGCQTLGPGAFVDGLPTGTIAAGTTPPFVAGGVLHLTDATNNQANYWITPIPERTYPSVTARWRTLIGGGGDTNNGSLGADGLSFSLGTDLGTSYPPEEGGGNGLSVMVDTFDDGGSEVGLEIKWNGQRVAFTRSGDGGNTVGAKAVLRRNQFLDTTLDVTSSGLATFTYAGLSVSGQLPGYSGIVAHQYVFAARTSTANDNHWIDDLSVHLQAVSGADLNVAFGVLPTQITEGDTFALTVTTSNAGPSSATGVTLTTALPDGLTLLSASGSPGGSQLQGRDVVCQLNTLAAGESVSVQLTLSADARPSPASEFETLSALSCVVSSTESEVNTADNRATLPLKVWTKRDFPDAPDTSVDARFAYPTLLADDAARHRITGPYFGGSSSSPPDGDTDGTPSLEASGDNRADGSDDETGVVILQPMVPGATGVLVQINAPVGGIVDGWIDFDRDGRWSPAPSPEQILHGVPVTAGVGTYSFDVPAGIMPGPTYARFRISTAGGLAFTGYAPDGEVEDYQVAIARLPGQFCEDFAGGLPEGTAMAGTPSPQVVGGALHLTDAATNQTGYWITPLSPQLVQAMTVRFKALIGGGSSPGADGLSFNLGRDLGTAFIAEEGAVNGLSVNVDTWDNGGAEVGLEIKWNGQRVGFTRVGNGTTAAQSPLRGNAFIDVEVVVAPSGGVTFSYAGFSVSAQLPNYTGILANQHVFAARTGGATDNHWIDDVCVRLESWPVADLQVALALPTTVSPGGPLVVSMIGSNAGPSTATSVQLGLNIPSGVVLQLVNSDRGSCVVQGSNVICSVTSLAPQESVTVQAVFDADPQLLESTGAESVRVDWTSFVSAVEPDPVAANNSAQGALSVVRPLDFPDAPASYGTLRSDNAARHAGTTNCLLMLGSFLDREGDGHPSADALGDDHHQTPDDEEAIIFLDPLVPGATVRVRVVVNIVPATCWNCATLNAWVDFNRNGVFDPVSDRIFQDVCLASGTHTLAFTVPPGASTGVTYSRFRLTSAPGTTPLGYSPDGEVEDYRVDITPPVVVVDVGLAANRTNVLTTENQLSQLLLTVSNRGPATATNVLLVAGLPPGFLTPAATNIAGPCQVISNRVMCLVASLASNAAFTVELTLRPRFLPESSNLSADLGTLTAAVGSAEFERNPGDNSLALPVIVRAQTDWADARRGFPVTADENGAHHRYSFTAPWLGTRWDNETPTGVHSDDATWDDTHGGGDDEDGVEFLSPLIPGTTASVIVTCARAPGFLDAWADFNQDTNWAGANEQIFASRQLVVGTNTLTFTVPVAAVPGTLTTRWRVSTTGGMGYTGYGGVGEVEDHTNVVQAVQGATDVNVAFRDLPSTAVAGQALSYFVIVSNASSVMATGLSVTVTHHGSVAAGPIVMASQGSCEVVNNEVRCTPGPLPARQSAILQITVNPGRQESLRIAARALSPTPETNLADNFANGGVVIVPWFLPECFCSCFTNLPWPSPDPLVTSWFTENSRQYAKVRLTEGAALTNRWRGTVNSMVMPATTVLVDRVYSDIQRIQSNATYVYVTAAGLASHDMGPWYCDTNHTALFPNLPRNNTATNRIPRNPIANSGHPDTPLGTMGLWVNGTAIYNMLDGFIYDPSGSNDLAGPGLTGYWHRNAYVSELTTFDPAVFHAEAHGYYHSHAGPLYLRAQLGDNLLITRFTNGEIAQIRELATPIKHSPILGWAFDGHPIYGPYGYSDPTNSSSGIRRIRSGYVLRDGANGTTDLRSTGRTTLPAWTLCMQDRTNQSLAEANWGPHPTNGVDTASPCNDIPWDLGRYAEDYAYLGDLSPPSAFGVAWDLDRYNGRCCKTPEFPDGTYAYFVTIDSNGVPAFPYIIGWEYCSETNGGLVTRVPEDATTVFSALQPQLIDPGVFPWFDVNGQIILRWSSRQDATYRVYAAEDLQQEWLPVSPSVPSGGTTTTYPHPLGPVRPPHQFFQIRLESDGGPTPRPNQ